MAYLPKGNKRIFGLAIWAAVITVPLGLLLYTYAPRY
jgi:hypothetical protein